MADLEIYIPRFNWNHGTLPTEMSNIQIIIFSTQNCHKGTPRFFASSKIDTPHLNWAHNFWDASVKGRTMKATKRPPIFNNHNRIQKIMVGKNLQHNFLHEEVAPPQLSTKNNRLKKKRNRNRNKRNGKSLHQWPLRRLPQNQRLGPGPGNWQVEVWWIIRWRQCQRWAQKSPVMSVGSQITSLIFRGETNSSYDLLPFQFGHLSGLS